MFGAEPCDRFARGWTRLHIDEQELGELVNHTEDFTSVSQTNTRLSGTARTPTVQP